MQPRIFDAFPFFNELDVLEIRLAELAPIVDTFVIAECKETYGGDLKPLHLQANWSRFKQWHHKIVPVVLDCLFPLPFATRTIGRQREASARDQIMQYVLLAGAQPNDLLSFGDCDEIPRATALRDSIGSVINDGIHRLKQRSFYYNVNRRVDYGHDFASRARIGRVRDVAELCNGSLYSFRMFGNRDLPRPVPTIEEGGWHLGYFGGIDSIKTKVAAMASFLAEYKLFGDQQLARDIVAGKDLHHRRCEMPETFLQCATDDPLLPQHFLDNPERFKHFTEAFFRKQHEGLL